MRPGSAPLLSLIHEVADCAAVMSATYVNDWQGVEQMTPVVELKPGHSDCLGAYLHQCQQPTWLRLRDGIDAKFRQAVLQVCAQVSAVRLLPIFGRDQQHYATLALLYEGEPHEAEAPPCLDSLVEALAMDLSTRAQLAAQRLKLKALEHEHWKLEATLRGTHAGTWEWNVQTGETRFNQRWAEIIGYDLGALQPVSIQTWLDHSHPDDLAESERLLNAHFQGESEFYECEARMRHRDGHWVWVLDRGEVRTWTADGQPEWMYGTHQEVTERVERERRLQQSEERLQRISETAGVGGWEVDVATGELSWSDLTFHIHGLPVGPVPSVAEAINYYAPAARVKIQQAVDDCMLSGTPWDLELPFIRANGEQIWVRAVGRAEQVDGEVVRLTGAFQDVTEARKLRYSLLLKQREAARRRREVERQQKELQKSNRLLDSFAYMVSHDLRAPLNNMRGMLDVFLAEMQCQLTPNQQQCQSYLLDAIDRMNARVAGLLALSRAQSKDLQVGPHSANKLVRAVLADLDASIQKANAQIVVGELPTVYCDRGLVEQVIQNLLENSLRYAASQSLQVQISGGVRQGRVWLRLEDDGPGIPEADRERIFRIFERAADDAQGSGLGLSICDLIMRKHGGRIACEPVQSFLHGTAFVLQFPARK